MNEIDKQMIDCLKKVRGLLNPDDYFICNRLDDLAYYDPSLYKTVTRLKIFIAAQLQSFSYGEWLQRHHPMHYARYHKSDRCEGRKQWIDHMIKSIKDSYK